MADPPPPPPATAIELTASQERLMTIIRDTDTNIFLTGDAGTGKTFVIEVAKRHLASVGKRYETVAFTGSAAFNANGNTIHAAFHPLPFIPGATPDDHGSTLARSLPELLYQLLSNTVHGRSRRAPGAYPDDEEEEGAESYAEEAGARTAAAARRIDWTTVDVLFIDEVSLIDAALFALVDRRLQLIRGNRNPFGGVRLVVAGDFGQLPPLQPSEGEGRTVASSGLYCFQPLTLKGGDLPIALASHAGERYTPWADSAFTYVRLLENVRASGDNNLRDVAECARSMRPSAWPADVRAALLRRTYASEEESVARNPAHADALHIHWGNKEVRERNAEMNGKLRGAVLRSKQANMATIDASPVLGSLVANASELQRAEADVKRSMQKLLETFDPANSFELKVGTRIMVTENLQRGVFNGAVGTVIRMTTKRVRVGDSFEAVPAVRVLMDTTATEVDIERRSTTVTYTYYRGARLEANRVRVQVDCSWWPFTLGWAITYHKVQGKTIQGPITLFVGNFAYWRAFGMLYVGVTRATRLAQLALVPGRTQKARGAAMLENGFCSSPEAIKFMRNLERAAQFATADAAAWEERRAAAPPPAEQPSQPECVACLGKADCLLMPCKHLSTCVDCTEHIRATRDGRVPCPMCRSVAAAVIRVLY